MFPKVKLYKNEVTFFAIASLMVSFDVFLVLDIGGFSIRMSQLLLMLPIVLFILHFLIRGECKAPLGYKSLVVWFVFLVLFIPHTTFIVRNISYVIWMLFNILLIFSSVQFINNDKKLLYVFKAYLYSYLFVGSFGISQFVLSVLGINPPLVTQFWPNGIARINGFSFEPSYFATYMIMGWVLFLYLKLTKTSIVSKRFLNIGFGIITVSLILSTSRMGILMLGLWVSGYVILFLKWIFKGRFHKPYFKIILSFGVVFCAVVWFILFDSSGKYDFLLAGTGLKGTANHSVETRDSDLRDTLNVFFESPFIGYSLGGVAPAIGGMYGVNVTDQVTVQKYEGMSVFLEVLAASGIIGFIPFILYILSIIIKPLKLAKLINKDSKDILMGFALSLIAILILLQFNQNISRLYLWFHIALLSSAYSVSKSNFIRDSNEKKAYIKKV